MRKKTHNGNYILIQVVRLYATKISEIERRRYNYIIETETETVDGAWGKNGTETDGKTEKWDGPSLVASDVPCCFKNLLKEQEIQPLCYDHPIEYPVDWAIDDNMLQWELRRHLHYA